jgi:hypothetical protein
MNLSEQWVDLYSRVEEWTALTVVDLPQVYRNLAQDAADVTAALNHRRAGICRRLHPPYAAIRPCRRRWHRRDGATAAASATGVRRGAAA